MTSEEIHAMPAGRELDALVAEYVMGWRWWASRCWSRREGEEKVWEPWHKFITRPEWKPEDIYVPDYDYSESCRVSDGTEERWADWHRCRDDLPKYSTDLGEVEAVMEKLRESYRIVNLIGCKGWTPDEWKCSYFNHLTSAHPPREMREATGSTPALAICRCALIIALELRISTLRTGCS